MESYYKEYTREISQIAIEIWEDQLQKVCLESLSVEPRKLVYEVTEGIASIYYPVGFFELWQEIIFQKSTKESTYMESSMRLLSEELAILNSYWNSGVLAGSAELQEFYRHAVSAWVYLGTAYFAPEVKGLSQGAKEMGMQLRINSADFLEETNRIIEKTLKTLFPHLGQLVKYLSLREVMSNALPETTVLEARAKQYIYYNSKIWEGMSLDRLEDLAEVHIQHLTLPAPSKMITGQVAAKGRVQGRVRVLNKKSDIPTLQNGEILVTAMTTPDYLPAMRKASAYITDEGGITCHAAIIARELGKPCVIGTRFATALLKTGMNILLDADKGTINILD